MRFLFSKKNRLSLVAIGCLAFATACKKDKPYEIPTTYNFDNVNYSGQTNRLSMLTEIATYMKTAHIANAAPLDAQKLKDMYANANNPFTDAALNTSGKQLKDKTASSEQTKFEVYMDSIAAASQYTSNTTPSNGTAGIVFKNDGTTGYLVNRNGVELTQIIEKGLMGAALYYQATAVYLGSGKMDVDNETVVDGEGTAMEHHWDEAFGYFGVPTDFPTNVTGLLFWGKYCNARNTLMGSNATLMDAFLEGRAAISNKDLERRDELIDTIRQEWERVVAATAISYLNAAKESLGNDAGVTHHALSEAFAFVYSLQFGGNQGITTSQVSSILVTFAGSADPLQANFYGTTTQQLQSAIDALAGYFPSLESIKNDL